MRILTFILIFSLTFPTRNSNSIDFKKKLSNLSSKYICLMDYESGRILYEKNSSIIVPMASTTKIMTAVIALENSNLNEIVEVSKRASSIHGSTIGLKQGQKITLEELLYGLMLRSGNDCAIAIAEHVAGSVENFSLMMDSKAFDIGALNTHFSTPHGLDADGHFTTAYDMALITRHAFKNPTFSKIVATKDTVINGLNGPKTYHNINKLLWQVEGADGVKTGYTGKAGRCLVSSATRNGKKAICVVLDSHNRWEDSNILLDYGLDYFSSNFYINNEDFYKSIEVKGGCKSSVKIGIDESFNIPISDIEKEDIYVEKVVPDNLKAPLYTGQKIGTLDIYSKGKRLFSIPYKVMDDVKISIDKSIIRKLIA